MRFGFVTCVKLGLSCMEAIYEIGGSLELVLTLEDDMAKSKSGRVFVDDFCAANAIDLVKVRNINSPKAIAAIHEREIDWLFIIGWSQIAREEVLFTPVKGVIGMHPTLLPIGRGRAAIPWAILKGLDKTGVTMFQLDSGVDTGPIFAQEMIPLDSQTNATELYDAVDRTHVSLMKRVFPKIQDGSLEPRAQNDRFATEWPGRTPEDGRIDPGLSVIEAERLVRATTHPYPGAFAELPDGRLVIWSARIARDGEPILTDHKRIDCPDGTLVATDWQWADASEEQR